MSFMAGRPACTKSTAACYRGLMGFPRHLASLLVGAGLSLASCGRATQNASEATGGAPSASGGALFGGSSGAAMGGATAANGGAAQSSAAGNGGAPSSSCSFPQSTACPDGCADIRLDSRHCGSCERACGTDERCFDSECEAEPLCQSRSASYAPLDGAWDIAVGDNLSFDVTLQPGPAVLRVHAKALQSTPERPPRLRLGRGSQSFDGVPITSSAEGEYDFAFVSEGGSETLIFSLDLFTDQSKTSVSVTRVEVDECEELERTCRSGGVFYSEANACAPFVCDAGSDCGLDLPGSATTGVCEQGRCHFPKCTDLAPSDLAFEGNSYSCFTMAELADPLSSPHLSLLDNDVSLLECPSIESLTWRRDPFRGEGSCIEGPLCGPNHPSEVRVGGGDDDSLCCYLIERVCGV
jgi:hypothetical protein